MAGVNSPRRGRRRVVCTRGDTQSLLLPLLQLIHWDYPHFPDKEIGTQKGEVLVQGYTSRK